MPKDVWVNQSSFLLRSIEKEKKKKKAVCVKTSKFIQVFCFLRQICSDLGKKMQKYFKHGSVSPDTVPCLRMGKDSQVDTIVNS